ncbi:MAG: hypothetical protein HRS50_01205 [Mycoplasmataceae bacterium]|nr:hypothetical protein [Mycoplasmataceae bacterium]
MLEQKRKKFESRHSLTLLLMMISGFLTFYFLVSGSMSDNRFGTHLVMSADLTSSPMWYVLTILYLSIGIVFAGLILFYFLYKGKLNFIKGQEKIIRISSLFIIGSATFFIALSSITFAVFNTDFFVNTIGPWKSIMPVASIFGGTHAETHYAIQGVVIASLSIVSIVSIVGISLFFVIIKKDFSDRLYFSMRNGALLLIGIGWLIFLVNLNAFGAMGGDASILINGVLNTNIDFDNLGSKLSQWSLMDSGNVDSYKDSFVFFIDDIINSNSLPSGKVIWGIPFTGLHLWWGQLWTTGNATNGSFIPDVNIGQSLPGLIHNGGFAWISNLNKPSFIQGVNESMAAMGLFILLLLLSLLITPIYIYSDYKFINGKSSIVYNYSIYSIIGTTTIFVILSFIIPYIDNVEGYDPILDGLFGGNGNGVAPGPIAPSGEFGGILGAIVYFSPNYHGTVVWWFSFGCTIGVPTFSLIITLLLNKKEKDSKVILNV